MARDPGEWRRERLRRTRLYCITPEATPARVEELARAALRGGADAIQLRQKALPRGELLALARRLVEPVRAHGALLFIDDQPDIACLSGADGVHLGADDLPLSEARRMAPNLLIGGSAGTSAAGRECEAAGADYLGVGPVFATPIKGEKAPIGPEAVGAVAAAVAIPVFAIGGINLGNVEQVVRAGIDRVCVIRGWAAEADPEMAVRELRKRLG